MDKKPNEKKVLALSFLGVLTFIAVVVGATYAYFTAQGGGTGNINVNATTNTTDNLSFQVGNAISLTANQEDFAQGMGNKSGSTTAKAILTANNATNNATRNYYVYLNITSNDFEYTTVDEQAEILLKVTDPEGAEVTTLGSLERKTSGTGDNQVTGFDITTQTGLITIADNYEITSTGTEEQEWKIEVIFANLDSDQNKNTGKVFNAILIVQEDLIPTMVADICESGDNLASCITEFNTLAGDGADGIYYHDADLTNGANDNSYRYAGANPNNYVCFGSDAASCPADNLYRIIGVFNGQVKLIKSDYATSAQLGTDGDYYGTYPWGDSNYKGNNYANIASYYWNYSNGSSSTNDWSTSNLNTVNLNTNYINYLNNIDSKWTDKIATTEWKVGGNTYANISEQNAPTAYQNEIVSPAEATTYSAKIGLMYVSDYMYGAAPTYWTYKGYDTAGTDYRAAINDNWMYMGLSEWTISRHSDVTNGAFFVVDTGYVRRNSVNSILFGVRPSFYLESNVEFSQGDGTFDSPYRIQAGA